MWPRRFEIVDRTDLSDTNARHGAKSNVRSVHDASNRVRATRQAWISGFLSILFVAVSPGSSVHGFDDISLIAVGDIMLGRFVEERYCGNIDIPGTRHLFRSADIVFGNLESCFGGRKDPDAGRPISVKAPDRSVRVLKDLGFTVVSLANNHCTDYGAQTAEDTLSLLDTIGIRGFGHRSATFLESAILDVKGTKIGFLGYSAHMKCEDVERPDGRTNPLCVDQIKNDVAAIRHKVNVLVASLHWGKEYSEKPTREQIATAHLLIDSGIDVILGHHPHVIQGIENYRGKLIAYSLGNFLFDQRSPPMNRSIAIRVKIRNRDLAGASVIPLILDRYLPRPAAKEEAVEIKETIERLSSGLSIYPDRWIVGTELTLDRSLEGS